MNKAIVLLLFLFFLIASPCTQSASGAEGKKIKILTSFLPIYIFTLNVVGESERVDVDCLIPGETGPHDYQMRPSDMRKVADADFMIINGLGLEAFISDIMDKRARAGTLFESASGLPLLDARSHHEDGEGAHAHHGDHNPHTWVSPKMAAMQVRNIIRFLSAIDPAGARDYRERGENYARGLDLLNEEMQKMVATLPRKRIVTVHNAFDYLARDTGLELVSVIYHTPGEEPSASEMAGLTTLIRKEKVKAVFSEPQFSDKMVHIIAKEAGVMTGMLDPVATGHPSKSLYEEVMRKNMKVLEEILSH